MNILKLSHYISAVALYCVQRVIASGGGPVEFETCSASPDSSTFKDLKFVSRVYVPYGIDQLTQNATIYGYGYGMGAAEKAAYDAKNKYIYAMSEQGVVTVVDMMDTANPRVLSEAYMLDLGGATLTDVKICPDKELLFISRLSNGSGKQGDVLIYTALQRSDVLGNATSVDKSLDPKNPSSLLATVPVGSHPDMILPNPDCSMLGVANEGEGTYDTYLEDAVGSVSLIDLSSDSYDATAIPFDMWSDDELVAKDVHLPLPLNGLIYWDQYSSLSSTLDFSDVIANYNAGMNLEPEYLAWSPDGSYLYVNCQENSAIVTVDVASKSVADIYGMGVKSWNDTPIDIYKDDGCAMITPIPELYSGYMADSIEGVSIDGTMYIITADEGDDKEYGDFEEKVKADELFGGMVFNGTVPIYDCSMSTESQAVCDSSLRVTVGSSAVNYTDPTAPVIESIVSFGGRGISILKVPGDTSTSSMTMIWNSMDEFEQATCTNVPWAHNSVQDEEFAPLYGVLYNTTDDDLRETIREINDPAEDGCTDQGDGTPGACPLSQTVDERSEKDGPAPEAVAVGSACGRLFLVTASEKGGSALLYDITDITNPNLVKVFHLSPASKDKSAGLAYDARELGDVDSETIVFLEASESPSGKASVMFVGAWSGTISYYEFECADDYVEPTAEELLSLCGTSEEGSSVTTQSAQSSAMSTSTLSFKISAVFSGALTAFLLFALA